METANNTTEIGFHIEMPKGAAFGWPELRNFMDSLVKAVASHPEKIRAVDMLPVRVEEGSFVPVIRGPVAMQQSFQRLERGPATLALSWLPVDVTVTSS